MRLRTQRAGWRTAALALVVASSAAQAQWAPAQANGVPFDVEFFSATEFVVSTNAGVTAFVSDVPTSFAVGARVAAGFISTGCVWHLDSLAQAGISVIGTATCPTLSGVDQNPNGATAAFRSRAASAGTGRYLFGRTGASGVGALQYAPDGHTTWANNGVEVFGVASPFALAARRVGSDDYGLMARGSEAVDVYANGSPVISNVFARAAGQNRDLVLLHEQTPPAALFLRSDGLLDRVIDVTVGASPRVLITLPGPAVSLDYDGVEGGYGAAIAADNASIYRTVPVPVGLTGALAGTWTTTAVAPALPVGARLVRIKCHLNQVCVALTDQPSGNNVFILRNDSAPVVTSPSPYALDETPGSTVVVDVKATSSDVDGDPLYFTVDPGTSPFSFTYAGNDRGAVTLTSTAARGQVCGTSVPFTLGVSATDGLNTGTGSITVNMRQTSLPDAPGVSSPDPTITSLLDPSTVNASPGPTGCTPTSYAWQQTGTTGTAATNLTPAGNGSTAQVVPQLGDCSPMSGTVTYEAKATDAGGTSPASSPLTLTVNAPGLPPNAPTVAPPTQTLSALTAAGTVTAARTGTDGCAPTSYAWQQTATTGNAAATLTPVGDGSSAEIRPVLGTCVAMSGTVTYQSTASHAGGASAASSAIDVVISAPALPPEAPTVGAANQPILSRASPATLSAARTGTSGCAPTSFSWAQTSTTGDADLVLTPSGDGSSAQADPAVGDCSPMSGTATYQATATHAGGSSAPSTEVTVAVSVPGIPPDAPTASPAAQTLGSLLGVATVSANATGTCAPTSYAWEQVSAPAGVELTLTPVGDGSTAELRPVVGDCSAMSGTATYRATASNSGGTSPASTTVAIDVNAPAIPPAAPLATPASQTLTSLLGVATLGASPGPSTCAPTSYAWELAGVTGNVDLELTPSSDGTTAEARPRLVGGCAGMSGTATYRAIAQHAGGASSPSASVTVAVDAAGLAPEVGTVTLERAVAVCGQGVITVAKVTRAPDSCPSSTFRCADGAGVSCTPVGDDLEVRTAETQLENLVGTELEVAVIAESDGMASAPATQRIQIVAEPFIAVSHRADAPLVEQTGQVGIAARFENQSDCAVQSTTIREELEGMVYVEGSARLDGQPVAVRIADGGLEVDGVALAARSARELTYLARPTVTGQPQPSAVVSLRGVPVSAAAGSFGGPLRTGCGCSATGGLELGGLLALLGVLARRRRQIP